MAIEKSRLELRICENDVRSIASPISSTMPVRRCWITDTVMASTGVVVRCGPLSPVLSPAAVGVESSLVTGLLLDSGVLFDILHVTEWSSRQEVLLARARGGTGRK
jgi:hypothetical protein